MCVKRDDFFGDLGADIEDALREKGPIMGTYQQQQVEVLGISDTVATFTNDDMDEATCHWNELGLTHADVD